MIAWLIALAVIAGACGSDGDTLDVAEQEAAETSYLEAIQTIGTDTDEFINGAFETAFADTEGLAFETTLPLLSTALDRAINAQQEAIASYESLEPPPDFAADHDRSIRFLRDQIDAWTRQKEAADTGNTEVVAAIDLELQSMTRDVLADLSPEFARHSTEAEGAAAIIDLFGSLTDDETAYLDAVAAGWDEFGRRNREFGAALSQTYGSDQLLLQALLDAGAGEAFAATRAAIVEIDPPDSYADAHALLLAYLDETVALDTDIAEAANNGDVVGFEVANYGLALAGARFVLSAPPSLTAIISDPLDLAAPDDLPGGSFGEELWEALQRFRVLALRNQIESGVFPVVSDESLAAAIASVTPTVIELTEDAVAEVEALAPPDDLGPGHDRILTYLNDLLTLRRSVLGAATEGDLDTLRDYGELGGVAAERAETDLWCSALADLSDDPIELLTTTLFRPFEVPTVAQLCPDA